MTYFLARGNIIGGPCLTTVVGMGTGVTKAPSSPGKFGMTTGGRPPGSVFDALFQAHHTLGAESLEKSGQVDRPISTGQLRALPPLHLRPINVVVFHGTDGDV